MKKFYLGIVLFCICLNATAQFSGGFAPAHWNTVLSPGSNGSVNASGAPASIIITGSNDPTNVNIGEMNTDYTITVGTAGILRFDWVYHTNDSDNDPQYDLAGVLINDGFTQLTSNTTGMTDQSGTYTVNVAAGTSIGFRISATDNLMGDATFTITNFSAPASVLPLTLTSFLAKQLNDKVLLHWTTLDESNMSSFDVERSADGNQFASIATMAAKNLQGMQQYETIDANPLLGTSFYRLKIKENNGQQRYSVIAVIKRSLTNLQLYPNPVKDNLQLNFKATVHSQEKIEIVDAGGRVLQSHHVEVKAGQNSLRFFNLPTVKGIYYIRTQAITVPFLKD